LHSLGGNPNVLISIPEIKSFKIKKETDFILIGCDGIFDKLTNCDVVHSIWSLCAETHSGKDLNEHSGKISDIIIRNCLASSANDNLTCIFICFENYKNLLFENNTFNINHEKLEKIIKSLISINNESFIEKENDTFDCESHANSSNNMQTSSNIIITNNNVGYTNSLKPKKKTSQKSIFNNNNNIINHSKNENFSSEKKKEKKNLQLNINYKLHSPSNLKVLSPINNSNINKHFSPSNNSINNLNPNFINNNNFNQTFSSNDEGILNKRVFSNKNVNFTTKLDLISPKNSINPLIKKSNNALKLSNEDKLKSLPAININGSLKKGTI